MSQIKLGHMFYTDGWFRCFYFSVCWLQRIITLSGQFQSLGYKYQWKHCKRRFNFQGWDQGTVRINVWILGNIHIMHWIKSSCLPSHCVRFVFSFDLYFYLICIFICICICSGFSMERDKCVFLYRKRLHQSDGKLVFAPLTSPPPLLFYLEAEQKLGHQ